MDPKPASARPAPRRLWRFLGRALLLRCPECGVSPLFTPALRTRTLHDWLHPLPGCDRCGYAYEREPGYFLPATWIVQFGFVFGFGIALGFVVQYAWGPPVPVVLLAACVPTLVLAFLFARHAKAIYLAVEHAVDPHVK